MCSLLFAVFYGDGSGGPTVLERPLGLLVLLGSCWKKVPPVPFLHCPPHLWADLWVGRPDQEPQGRSFKAEHHAVVLCLLSLELCLEMPLVGLPCCFLSLFSSQWLERWDWGGFHQRTLKDVLGLSTFSISTRREAGKKRWSGEHFIALPCSGQNPNMSLDQGASILCSCHHEP